MRIWGGIIGKLEETNNIRKSARFGTYERSISDAFFAEIFDRWAKDYGIE